MQPELSTSFADESTLDMDSFSHPTDDSQVLDILPDPLKRYCADVAERLASPVEYLVASTLCATGAAICSRCGIRPKLHDSWLVTPNLWALLVGEPSSMKSPAMSQPLSLLRRVENRIQETSPRTTAQSPRLIANDATGEKLVELLRDNSGGLLVVRDELAAVFESWQRSGRQGERQLYLEAWNGTSPYTVDRIGRGTIAVKNLSVSFMGTIQPSQLAKHLGASGLEDGLAQRFQLLVFPLPKKRVFCDKPEDTSARTAIEELLFRLATADYRQLCNSSDSAIPSITFSADAYSLYKTWWMDNAESVIANPLLASFLTKHERLVPALALVDHLVCSLSDDVPAALPPVSRESLTRAIQQADFFKDQVVTTLSHLGSTRTETTIEALSDRLVSGQLSDGFSVRDILRFNWTRLNDREAVERAVECLVQEGRLAKEIGASGHVGGRPTVRYRSTV